MRNVKWKYSCWFITDTSCTAEADTTHLHTHMYVTPAQAHTEHTNDRPVRPVYCFPSSPQFIFIVLNHLFFCFRRVLSLLPSNPPCARPFPPLHNRWLSKPKKLQHVMKWNNRQVRTDEQKQHTKNWKWELNVSLFTDWMRLMYFFFIFIVFLFFCHFIWEV